MSGSGNKTSEYRLDLEDIDQKLQMIGPQNSVVVINDKNKFGGQSNHIKLVAGQNNSGHNSGVYFTNAKGGGAGEGESTTLC